MESDLSPRYRRQPSFQTWLLHNPTGIPPCTAMARAVVGVFLGGLISYLLTRIRATTNSLPQTSVFISSVVGGSTLGPLGVVLVTYHLDRSRASADEHLMGYSGVMRELFHAGELACLGAIGGGLGAGQGSSVRGLLTGGLGTSVLGGMLYALRGFGPAVGMTAGLISGAIGGVLGGSMNSRPAD